MSLTYTLEQVEQVLSSFAPDLLGAEFRAGSHDLPAAESSWGNIWRRMRQLDPGFCSSQGSQSVAYGGR